MLNQDDKCFCCGKPFRGSAKHLVDCGDDQLVFVGPDCYRHIVSVGCGGYQHPRGGGALLYPFEGRFVVEIETNGAGTATRKEFPAYHAAIRFARKVTMDGTAWPAVAVVNCEVRESAYDPWHRHRHLPPVVFVDGQMQ